MQRADNERHENQVLRSAQLAASFDQQDYAACETATGEPRCRDGLRNKSKVQLMVKILLCLSAMLGFISGVFIYKAYIEPNQLVELERPAATLRLVSIFQRHGDRAPSDHLPMIDRHAEQPHLFWPNGLGNLTDSGRMRMFRLGVHNRFHYDQFLDYSADSVLALVSDQYRCLESAQHFLRGLFDTQISPRLGLANLMSHLHCRPDQTKPVSAPGECHSLPAGSGSPDEWQRLQLSPKMMPSLSWTRLNGCKFRKENPSPVDEDLESSAQVRRLQGVKKLRKLLQDRYNQTFNFEALGIWSTVNSELALARTRASINYTDHFSDWIQLAASPGISLLDLFEQVYLLAHRDRITHLANLVQTGPLIKSLIESQLAALASRASSSSQTKQEGPVKPEVGRPAELMRPSYEGKRLIFYSSHDTILQLLLFRLGIMRLGESSFETRFRKWDSNEEPKNKQPEQEVAKLLEGLKMCQYGLSIKFELWQLENAQGEPLSASYVSASIYNNRNPNWPIHYEPVHLNSICRGLFLEENPAASLDSFYPEPLQLDHLYNCPFELFQNVTNKLTMADEEVEMICGK